MLALSPEHLGVQPNPLRHSGTSQAGLLPTLAAGAFHSLQKLYKMPD